MADTTIHDDNKRFNGLCTFAGGTATASAATAPSTAAGSSGILSGAFVLADITAGTKVFTSLPAGAVVRGATVKITTALTFTGDTTGVSLTAGTTGDGDAWLKTTAIAGAAGNKYPTAGGDGIGMATGGGSGTFTLTFTATGGSANLAHVSAGAGTVYLDYIIPA